MMSYILALGSAKRILDVFELFEELSIRFWGLDEIFLFPTSISLSSSPIYVNYIFL